MANKKSKRFVILSEREIDFLNDLLNKAYRERDPKQRKDNNTLCSVMSKIKDEYNNIHGIPANGGCNL